MKKFYFSLYYNRCKTQYAPNVNFLLKHGRITVSLQNPDSNLKVKKNNKTPQRSLHLHLHKQNTSYLFCTFALMNLDFKVILL